MNINLNITASPELLSAIANFAAAFTRVDQTPAAEPKKKVNRKVETVVPETLTMDGDMSGNANTVVEETPAVIERVNPLTPAEVIDISLEDIRAVAAKKTKEGKRLEVQKLLLKHGAFKPKNEVQKDDIPSLPLLDKAKYADFFTELNAL